MSVFHAMGLIVTLVALFGYLNHRFIGLPDTVGITAIGLVAALGVTAYGPYDPAVVESAAVGECPRHPRASGNSARH